MKIKPSYIENKLTIISVFSWFPYECWQKTINFISFVNLKTYTKLKFTHFIPPIYIFGRGLPPPLSIFCCGGRKAEEIDCVLNVCAVVASIQKGSDVITSDVGKAIGDDQLFDFGLGFLVSFHIDCLQLSNLFWCSP